MTKEAAAVGTEVVYESVHVGVGHRLAVALGSGLTVFAAMAFLRWGCGAMSAGPRGMLSGGVVGAIVAAGMAFAALRSRTVWRVTLDRAAGVVRVDRDPNVVERFDLADVIDARAVPVAGGWSRDPSERLALRLRDGRERAFALPDDALTTGIAADILAARSAVEAREDVAKDPAGGGAGAREVGEQGVEGRALGPVAVPEPPRDGDGRRG
jgi:hypothetical protein